MTPEQARQNYANTEEAFDALQTYFLEFGELPADDFDLEAYYRAAPGLRVSMITAQHTKMTGGTKGAKHTR